MEDAWQTPIGIHRFFYQSIWKLSYLDLEQLQLFGLLSADIRLNLSVKIVMINHSTQVKDIKKNFETIFMLIYIHLMFQIPLKQSSYQSIVSISPHVNQQSIIQWGKISLSMYLDGNGRGYGRGYVRGYVRGGGHTYTRSRSSWSWI